MLNYNVDSAVECVKTINDNTQCLTCDKLSGPCVRFPCGHSVCASCAERAGECLFCVSSSTGSYLEDKPLTARVNHASTLLSAFQEAFQIDVSKRLRLSDHLKLEKQVFPECIQAPHKYSNKRKSLNTSFKNKENISQTVFPGEEISSTESINMNKSFQYVQNWLNQHESLPQNSPRKPFGDININSQSFVYKGKRNVAKASNAKSKINTKYSTFKKRTHLKSLNNSPSLLKDLVKDDSKNEVTLLSARISKQVNKHEKSEMTRYKCEKNESGIVIDDEPTVVEDTKVEIIDKDKLAWLAVIEAAEKDEKDNQNQISSDSVLLHNKDKDICLSESDKDYLESTHDNKSDEIALNASKRVLFYKKSALFETCKLCRHCIHSQTHSNSSMGDNNSDVSIVINNSTFITTIKFSQYDQLKHERLNKKSVAIQTFLPEYEIKDSEENISRKKRKILQDENEIPTKIIKTNVAIQSQDIFPTNKTNECAKIEISDCKDIQRCYNDSLKQLSCDLIEDSDSESNISHGNVHEVVADIHRTCVPETVGRGILTTLPKQDLQFRSNRPLRGRTPNSTDSSDKENLDPNRTKKNKFVKKQKLKRKK